MCYVANESLSLLLDNKTANDTRDFSFPIENITLPLTGVICIIGLVGNTLNVIFLTTKGPRNVFYKEQSAYFGFLSLAISDAHICLLTLPRTFIPHDCFVFERQGFALFYQQYGIPMLYSLIFCSTWFTVNLAVCRCIIVRHPFRAHSAKCVSGVKTLGFTLGILVVAILLCLMQARRYAVETLRLPDGEKVMLIERDQDPSSFYVFGMYHWCRFILGFLVPLLIQILCNICLIVALRQSDRARECLGRHAQERRLASRITPTLIAILCAYILLMTPSELLEFIFDSLSFTKKERAYLVGRELANVLQITNFSINFLLHIGVNCSYRSSVIRICRAGVCCRRHGRHNSDRVVCSEHPSRSTRWAATIITQSGNHRHSNCGQDLDCNMVCLTDLALAT